MTHLRPPARSLPRRSAIAGLAALGLVALSLAALSLAATPAVAADTLTVGAYPANPPWEFKSADGTFQGFEVDLAKEVAKRLGMDAAFQDTGFQALFAATSSGRIDMAISSITITNDRLRNQAFTQPYYDSDGAILAKSDSKIASIDDLKGTTLGVIATSSGESFMKANAAKYGIAGTKSYNTQQDLLLDAGNGRVDGAVGEVAGFQYAIKKMQGLKIAIRIPTGESFAIMMKKGSPLLAKVNDAIGAIKTDGTMAAIHKTWFGTDAPAESSTVKVMPLPMAK